MKRVLVTGAAGFIGRHAIEPLIGRGYEVHAVTRRRGLQIDAVEKVHVLDLMSRHQVEKLMNEVRPSHLLHLAWDVPPGEFWTSLENFRWVGATLEIVRAFANTGGKRCVAAGSCAEYDWTSDCCSSSTPTKPSTVYGVCKNASRQLFDRFMEEASLSGAWGRIFYLYGPHEPEARLVPSIIRSILLRRHVDCTNGTQKRDFLHVQDVASALVAVLDSSVTGPVDIGSGIGTPVRDIILTLARSMEGEQWVHLGARPAPSGEPDVIAADTNRLAREVRWLPAIDLATGLADAVRWWRTQV